MDFFMLGFGIAVAGYFVGNGLSNFNQGTKSGFDLLDEEDEHKLIPESDVHYFLGVTKEDAKVLIQEHPDIPHIQLNGKVYFPKSKLREWLLKIGS
ncbi:DNA-binding protein [Desmospora profundinema]|uniref:DNA-binding protein n=1 Tax=Desmospora profundinema TaxID=1571184 RepID=A0ABU1IMQ2_9BACL|nr:DNA-binding protein [Desmospora profundinema]MDR6225444.1 hypothetical protein [Desmospora profundinema]